MATTQEIQKLKEDFFKWSGFELEPSDYQGMIEEITEKQSILEDEATQQGKIFRQRVREIFPDNF
jgi:hypothetical protein